MNFFLENIPEEVWSVVHDALVVVPELCVDGPVGFDLVEVLQSP